MNYLNYGDNLDVLRRQVKDETVDLTCPTTLRLLTESPPGTSFRAMTLGGLSLPVTPRLERTLAG